MLDALERLGPRARGIARLPLTVSSRSLAALAARGVVGVRLDLVAEGLPLLEDPALERFLRRLCDLDLLLDVQCEGDQMASLAPVLARTPVKVVVDHCGRPDPARGVRSPGFAALLRLAELGRVNVKLSGPNRSSRRKAPYADMAPCIRALIAAYGPDALVWGSDWPFLRCEERMDYAPLLALLERWMPSAADRRRVLCRTPARLFRF
jgi:predicted TIM-barrel fold metal-dependent hydrolase